jgi:hypothetical protein
MANHCVHIACANCGARYCLRDCGNNTGPDEKMKAIITASIKRENSNRYQRMRCRYCKTENLYWL